MLKSGSKSLKDNRFKRGSVKPRFVGALASGLNRRAFLKQSSIAVLMASLSGCKPNIQSISIPQENVDTSLSSSESLIEYEQFSLTEQQKETLSRVQLKLFPNDGDGPSAEDLNALEYLQWALTDTDNSADGDGEFIIKGIGWLDSLAEQTQGDRFVKLSSDQQDKILTKISQSNAGENWLSILIYYLIEALVLDPIYGGNPNGIGWKWLNHQAGYPRPTKETSYRSFR